ncbi:MAG TPA: cytochrome P450 [Planctomycetales bacterium]|jgi:cytochrome P450|nr:cytochrome P450 [Planctomycetales bacterium]
MRSSLFRLVHGSKMKALDGFPGPAPSFPFGNGLDFVGKLPWEVCARYAREYGGVTRIWLGGRPALVLNDPKLIGEVLDTRADDFYKNSPRTALLPVITDNCPFIANGADWKAKRESHPFRMDGLREWLASQVEPMRAMLREGVRLLKNVPGPVDVTQTVQQLGFDAFSVAVWGCVLGADVYEWFLTLGKTGDLRMKLDLMAPLFPPINPWFYSARRKWFALFSSLMDQAKAPDQPPRSDLLSVLLQRGRPSSDAFRDAMANIFFGGAFSAFSAVTSSLYSLAHNPAVEQRLRVELGALVGRDPDYDLEALESCTYLDCVLREALRVYSPAPLYFRNSAKDRSVSLGGQTLPPNTLLFISNWFLHHDPAHWNDPDRFDPSRWENGGAEQNPFGSGWYFPFGRGPRTCVGQPFAMMAMKLTLAEILTNSRLELDRTLPYRQDFFFGVMTPKGLKGSFRPVGSS